MKEQARNESGITLIELMIATSISVVIVAAGFATLTTGYKTTRVNNLTADTQQNARAAMDMIASDIKAAGFGITNQLGIVAQVGSCAIGGVPAPIVPQDNTPGGADTGPDGISMVVPMTNTQAAPLWQLSAAAGPGIPSITLPAGAVTAMQAVPSGLAPGSVISIGGATAIVGAIGAGGIVNLNPALPAPVSAGAGTQVYLLQCVTYQVIGPPDANNLCQGNAPCLVRGVAPGTALNCNVAGSGCLPILNGIEDLQLAFACDGCVLTVNSGNPDGIIDDQNASSTFDQADFITNSTWPGTSAGTLSPTSIRLVQINLVAREAPKTTGQDQGFGEGNAKAVSTNAPVIVSDHNHANGVFAAGDLPAGPAMTSYLQLRRRILTRTVELRNVGT
ncbi:MAG TPA: PilW family protein [Nitrospira sp.]|nr:PilW family protein [Nitrospira sp.]